MKRIRAVMIAVCIMLATTACTPEEVKIWSDHVAWSYPSAIDNGLTESKKEAIKLCESGGNYQAISPNGIYKGAYQFDQRTWDSVASRWAPFLRGIDPRNVDPAWQDHMFYALYSERGAQPWPTCGRRG
jgi:hypothetical protein